MRDIENDKICGKQTVPVLIGINKARIYHFCLIIGAFLSITVYMLLQGFHPIHFLYLLTLPFFIIHLKKTIRSQGKALDAQLKILSISTLLFALLVGFSLNF